MEHIFTDEEGRCYYGPKEQAEKPHLFLTISVRVFIEPDGDMFVLVLPHFGVCLLTPTQKKKHLRWLEMVLSYT